MHIISGFCLFEQAQGYYLPMPLQANLEVALNRIFPILFITLAYFHYYLRTAKFEVNQP